MRCVTAFETSGFGIVVLAFVSGKGDFVSGVLQGGRCWGRRIGMLGRKIGLWGDVRMVVGRVSEAVEGDVLDIWREKRVWWRVMIYKAMFVERESA